MASIFPLPIDGDFYYKFALTNPDGTAKAGLADVTVGVSLADGGASVAGLTPVSATEVGTGTGVYAMTLAESALQAGLAALIGTTVYVVIYEGAKVLGSDPCTVTAAARVG